MAATPTNIVTNLRDAEDRFLNTFNQIVDTSVFEGLTLEADGTKGYVKYAMMFSRAVYQKLVDEVEAAGLLTKPYEISTDTWKNPIRIQRDTLEEAEAIIGGEFRLAIDNLALDAVQNRDQELTNLLDDNGNDVLGTSFFAAAGVIPNSDQTIANTQGGTGTTAAQITTDFFTALTLLANMRNAAGRKYYSSAGLGLGVTLMYPSALEGVMQNVFKTQLVSGLSGASNVLFNKATLRQNTLLSDADDWYLFVDNPRFPALVIAPAVPGPELESNVPVGPDNVDESVILTDSYLFCGRDKFATGYGSRYAIIRTTN